MKAESDFLIYHAHISRKSNKVYSRADLGGDMVGNCVLDDSFPHCSVMFPYSRKSHVYQ